MNRAYRHQKGLKLDVSERPKSVRAFLSQGIEPAIERLHQQNTGKRICEFAFFGGLYSVGALLMAVSGTSVPGFLAAVLMMGVAVNACGLFIHEGLHGVLAKGRHANRVASFLVGLPIMMSATAYRITHTYHHFELGKRRDLGTYRQHTSRSWIVWIAYLAQLTAGCILYALLVPYFGWRFGSRNSRRAMLIEYALMIAVFSLFFSFVPGDAILRYWLYPLLVMNVLTNVRGLASHALGDVENIYLSSRTITCPRWQAWLLLHENYHLEHHLFPRVPSYHLSELHRLIWKRLPRAVHSESYGHFLVEFLKAALKRDSKPLGLVHPRETRTDPC